MQLKLLRPDLASVYGVPAEDVPDARELVRKYLDDGWDEIQAANHIEAAITAGVYRRVEPAGEEMTYALA